MENIKNIKQEIAENNNFLAIDTTDKVAVKNRLQLLDGMGIAIKSALLEGIVNDYAVIPGCGNKPSLLQPGARKIVQMFGLKTLFELITSSDEKATMKCILQQPNGDIISESYGSCSKNERGKSGFCENNLIKFAQKRAMVGAVLQVSNLSKLFTQDIEDMNVSKNEVKETLLRVAAKTGIPAKQTLANDGIRSEEQMLTKQYLETLKGRLK